MTTLPQAEIDAAVKLAERTVVQAPLHKSHYAEFDAVTLARALLALAAERRTPGTREVCIECHSWDEDGQAEDCWANCTAPECPIRKPPTAAGEGW